MNLIKQCTSPTMFGLVLLGAACAAPAQSEDRAPERGATDAVFAEWSNSRSPGCALGIVKDGRIEYVNGYGMANLEHDVPITSDTVFYIASTSKQFVAMATLLASDAGYFSLDDDIREHFPELPDYGRKIRVRDLIHHTSGLRDYLAIWFLSGRSSASYVPEDQALDMIARQPVLVFDPGTKWLYSNTGYFLQALLIERATGRSLREFAEERIFQPLEMNDTHFHDDHDMIVKGRAMGHARTPDGRMNMVWSAFDLVGSGGLHTTVNDMLKWNANFEKPRLPGGSALMRRYLDPGVDVGKRARDLGEGPDHPTRYGFGLVHTSYRGIEVIQHSGQSFGYRAHFMRLPKQRFAAVALCNLLEIDPVALLRQVVDIHVPEASAPVGEPPEPFTPTVREPSYEPEPQQLARFEGSYYSRELDSVFRLRRTDRGLELRRHYSEPDLLVAVGPREFELPLLGGIVWASLRFLPGDRRELDELTLEMDRFGMIRLSRTE